MKIINTDDSRMIELPGVGPCPRPIDIDESVTGFKTLKSLRIYKFDEDAVIEGESEIDEVYIIPVAGDISLNITGNHPLTAQLSATGNQALYMSPDHAYQLTPHSETLVAYARAAADGRVATHINAGSSGNNAEKLAYLWAVLKDADALAHDATKERLIYVVSGELTVNEQTVGATQTLAMAAEDPAEDPAEIIAKGDTTVLLFSA